MDGVRARVGVRVGVMVRVRVRVGAHHPELIRGAARCLVRGRVN